VAESVHGVFRLRGNLKSQTAAGHSLAGILIFVGPDGTFLAWLRSNLGTENSKMNSVIYLIGLVVVVLAILSFLGLH
jgi:hypothetical protein